MKRLALALAPFRVNAVAPGPTLPLPYADRAAFEAIEIDSSPGNPWGIPKSAHSVVTNELVDREGHPTKKALDRVLAFFRERLLTS